MVDVSASNRAALARWKRRVPNRSRNRLTWDHLRCVFFVAVMTVLWITPNPNSVSFRDDPTAGREGNMTVQLLWFGMLFFGLIVSRDRYREIGRQFDATLNVLLLWCLMSTVFAIVPDVSFRRLLFAVVCMGLITLMFAGIKSQRTVLKLLLAMVAFEIVTKYVFVLAIPQVGKHGFLGAEPQLNGLWRGQHAHKNTAGPVCAYGLVILYTARRTLPLYVLLPLVLLEFVFLLFSGSKTPLILLIGTMILSSFVLRMRSGAPILAIVTAAVAFLNFVTLASVVSDDARALAQAVIGDTTFTGRVEVWRFLLHYAASQPLFGAGFQSFWQIGPLSPAVTQGDSWTTVAIYGHQGYLDTLVMIGLPGLVLTLLFVLVRPALDLGHLRNRRDPMAHMYVTFWLFGLFENGTESPLLARADPVWLFLVAGIVGIRHLRFEHAADDAPAPIQRLRRVPFQTREPRPV